jgi:hypothetical protein
MIIISSMENLHFTVNCNIVFIYIIIKMSHLDMKVPLDQW